MIRFQKMHGAGNDFVVVDSAVVSDVSSDLIRALCDPRRGIGADGVLLINSSPASMRMWNPDGSEAETCGNGLRCAARYLMESLGVSEVTIGTKAGPTLATRTENNRIRVDMGEAKLEPASILDTALPYKPFRGTAVSMGNPHLVIPVEDVETVDLEWYGPLLEKWDAFPNGTNVHFVQVLGPHSARQRTWERGAGATLACGSGACASAVALIELGLCESPVQIRLPGGRLEIEVDAGRRVHMTGEAEVVFEGVWPS